MLNSVCPVDRNKSLLDSTASYLGGKHLQDTTFNRHLQDTTFSSPPNLNFSGVGECQTGVFVLYPYFIMILEYLKYQV